MDKLYLRYFLCYTSMGEEYVKCVLSLPSFISPFHITYSDSA